MDKDPPTNIFDEASKGPKRKKKPLLKKKVPKKGKPKREGLSLGDPELEGILNKIRFMENDLKEKMEKISEISGISRGEISTYLENPSNFDKYQWDLMEKDKKVLEEKVYTILGKETKKKLKKKKIKKLQKKRKGKMLGARKNWLQM